MRALANDLKIVVEVDGSANSFGATRWAASLASRLRGPLHLLCAFDTQFFTHRESPMSDGALLEDRMRAAAGSVVDDAARVAVSRDLVARALLMGPGEFTCGRQEL